MYNFASLVRFVSFSKLFVFLVSLHVFSSVLGYVLIVSMHVTFIFSF